MPQAWWPVPPEDASWVALISQEVFKNLTPFPVPIVVVPWIFSHQALVSQDFVHLLHPVSDLELHPARTPNTSQKEFLLNSWQFWTMFYDLLLSLCVAKTWGLLPDPGVQNSSCTTSSLLQPRGEGKQLSHSHKAKNTEIFESIFSIFIGFPLNSPLHLLHTLHFTQILFSSLVCVCALLSQTLLAWKLCVFSQGEHTDFLFEICLERGSKNPPLSFHIQGRNRGRKVLHSPVVAEGKREYFCQLSTLGGIFIFFFFFFAALLGTELVNSFLSSVIRQVLPKIQLGIWQPAGALGCILLKSSALQ